MRIKRLGFTMLELLVVIVIISVMAALLFPVFGRIQERGREVKCASNLRQLHTAAMSYMSNSGGALPLSASAKVFTRNSAGEPWTISWANGWVASHPMNTDSMRSYWSGTNGTYCITNGTLFPYLGNVGDESVYVCPSMQREANSVKVTRSYGMNNRVSGAAYQGIDGLSRVILFADQGFKLGTRFLATGDSGSDAAPTMATPGTVYQQRFSRSFDGSIEDGVENIGELHGRKPGLNTGMANVIFCDGHVERVVYTNTVSVCSGAWEYGRPVK